MFFRAKKSGPRTYLQIVENSWNGGKVRQRVLATIGRLDRLRESGQLEALLKSGARFSEKAAVLMASEKGKGTRLRTTGIGPDLLFSRLWRDLGIGESIRARLADRRFSFPVERAIYLTVLHRLFCGGSDRAAEHWRRDVRIPGSEELSLHHLYRAMAWLGEELPPEEQPGSTGFSPRCVKDVIEEDLFARRRDLFTQLSLVFFDTTSVYFEGEGGEELGRYGKSKDHRPDRKQIVVGLILDGDGRPICSEIWPGNTTDVKTLLPVVDRLRGRFGIGKVTVVADRGMISAETIEELERRGMKYILGARLRSQKEVKEEVLSRAGAYRMVHGPRESSKDPSPLKVKQVMVEDRRYVVCWNMEQARKDAERREHLMENLRKAVSEKEAKAFVGNKGYRRFLKSEGGFVVDEEKAKADARYDGKWVLRTNLTKEELGTEGVAVRYKDLWMVEEVIRSMKSILENRPIYHKCDETIRGHVFSSFLALVLLKELLGKLKRKEEEAGKQASAKPPRTEWSRLKQDLLSVEETELELQGKRFRVRGELVGDVGKALQAASVAPPPAVIALEEGGAG
jgi:transposase